MRLQRRNNGQSGALEHNQTPRNSSQQPQAVTSKAEAITWSRSHRPAPAQSPPTCPPEPPAAAPAPVGAARRGAHPHLLPKGCSKSEKPKLIVYRGGGKNTAETQRCSEGWSRGRGRTNGKTKGQQGARRTPNPPKKPSETPRSEAAPAAGTARSDFKAPAVFLDAGFSESIAAIR